MVARISIYELDFPDFMIENSLKSTFIQKWYGIGNGKISRSTLELECIEIEKRKAEDYGFYIIRIKN